MIGVQSFDPFSIVKGRQKERKHLCVCAFLSASEETNKNENEKFEK